MIILPDGTVAAKDFKWSDLPPLEEFEQEILKRGGHFNNHVLCMSAINYDTNQWEYFEFYTKEEWDAFQELWDGEYVFKTVQELESYDRGKYGS